MNKITKTISALWQAFSCAFGRVFTECLMPLFTRRQPTPPPPSFHEEDEDDDDWDDDDEDDYGDPIAYRISEIDIELIESTALLQVRQAAYRASENTSGSVSSEALFKQIERFMSYGVRVTLQVLDEVNDERKKLQSNKNR